jgi:hypothetical protein
MYRLVNGKWKMFASQKVFELAIAAKSRTFVRNSNDRIEMQIHKKICDKP